MGKKVLHVAAAVIRRNGHVLLATRPEGKPPAGLEFPGGKIEPGESLKAATERELREELGADVLALDELFRISHETEKAVIHLRFIRTILPDVFGLRKNSPVWEKSVCVTMWLSLQMKYIVNWFILQKNIPLLHPYPMIFSNTPSPVCHQAKHSI